MRTTRWWIAFAVAITSIIAVIGGVTVGLFGDQYSPVTIVGLDGSNNGSVGALSCSSIGSCVALGTSGTQAFRIEKSSGNWTHATPFTLPNVSNSSIARNVDVISCSQPGNCTALGEVVIGDYVSGSTTGSHSWSYAITETKNSWRTGQLLFRSSATPQFTTLNCWSVGNCVASGLSLN